MINQSFAAGFLAGVVTPAIIVLAVIVIRTSGSPATQPIALPTPSATVTTVQITVPTPTVTMAPTHTPTAAPTPTPTPSPTPTATPTPSPTVGEYQTETIEVPTRRTTYVIFSVPDKYVLEGYFEVHGGNDDITFWASSGKDGDDDKVIKEQEIVGRGEFKLSGKKSGTYTLYFDNGRSLITPKQVTIYYRLRAD